MAWLLDLRWPVGDLTVFACVLVLSHRTDGRRLGKHTNPNISSFLYSFIYPFYTHVYTPFKLLLYSSYTHVYTHVYTPFILIFILLLYSFYTPVRILDHSLSHLSLTDSFCFSFFLILVPFTPYCPPSVGKQWWDRKRC